MTRSAGKHVDELASLNSDRERESGQHRLFQLLCPELACCGCTHSTAHFHSSLLRKEKKKIGNKKFAFRRTYITVY